MRIKLRQRPEMWGEKSARGSELGMFDYDPISVTFGRLREGGRNGIFPYGMIPSYRRPGLDRPRIEPGLPWWDASRLTAQPPRPPMPVQRKQAKWLHLPASCLSYRVESTLRRTQPLIGRTRVWERAILAGEVSYRVLIGDMLLASDAILLACSAGVRCTSCCFTSVFLKYSVLLSSSDQRLNMKIDFNTISTNDNLSTPTGRCRLEKAFSYLTGSLRIRQHRHGSYVIRVKRVTTGQNAIWLLSTGASCSAQLSGSFERSPVPHCLPREEGNTSSFGVAKTPNSYPASGCVFPHSVGRVLCEGKEEEEKGRRLDEKKFEATRPRTLSSVAVLGKGYNLRYAAVARWLEYESPTKANQVIFPARSPPPPPRFSYVGIVPDDGAGRRLSSGISRFPPPLHSCAAPDSNHVTLIGSQDVDVKSSPNPSNTLLFAYLLYNTLPRHETSKSNTIRVYHERSGPRVSSDVFTGQQQTACLSPRRAWFDCRWGPPGFSHVGIVPDDAAGPRVFLGCLPFPRPFVPALFRTHLSLTLIGSQDLDGRSRLNFFTH
ncbi:hypothetical protein PR048_027304 [Dryococelus australis]|uniref:Uncharacterized protein n=1 Tax=Dryococelus australis TaxID=614101 RepID=A0ABQ9GGA1_9NEOP|nr:hypothetical protein PR048_027304 [Dryococelus australis]